MKTIILAIALSLLVFAGYQWYSAHQADQFVAAKRAEFAGYRLEYFENEKVLIVHAPDGSKDGIELKTLGKIFLQKSYAAENTKNQDLYFLTIAPVERRSLTIPYFAVEPSELLRMLKKEVPDLDVEASLHRAHQFERNKFTFCSLWLAPGQKEFVPVRGYSVCPH